MTVTPPRIPTGRAWQDHWRPGPPTTVDIILAGVPEERGNCYGRGDDMFPKEGFAKERAAIALCKGCPIRTACLLMALKQDDQFGVWGGMSAATRRELKQVTAA